MESPTNRIKEVLTGGGIKQTWLAKKLGKCFYDSELLRLQSSPAMFGISVPNSRDITSQSKGID